MKLFSWLLFAALSNAEEENVALQLRVLGDITICTDECSHRKNYEPVCDSDGNTYDNDCIARCKKATEFTVGPCYTRGEKGDAACPLGFVAIKDKEKCKIAAKEVGHYGEIVGIKDKEECNIAAKLPGEYSLICKKSISATCDDHFYSWQSGNAGGCCEDTNNGATGWTGIGGEIGKESPTATCSNYSVGPDRHHTTGTPTLCYYAASYYDDADFISSEMCCGCGGGNRKFPLYWEQDPKVEEEDVKVWQCHSKCHKACDYLFGGPDAQKISDCFNSITVKQCKSKCPIRREP